MLEAASREIYGPFEVLERLGIGGMATVHRAIERGIEGFERVVALKRLLPHLAEDEAFVRAFVREAKLASLLQHGNIVQLYELGRVGLSYFISMEYIPGRDLRAILRQARRVCGPPPLEIALALLTELLDALDYAHSQCGADGKPLGLVHRDISPSNLIVSHTGHLKVIDFGIAKATLGHLMTHTGRIKGKLCYMAPEALGGRPLDGRSDLFSASVIGHEFLTATPLFAAKDDFQTIDRLQNMQPPPPSARNPACPPELDEIVLRGLAKEPGQRWRSAAEMRAALAAVAMGRYRLATNREVSEWVDEAFETPLPSRLRLPVAPPSMVVHPPDPRRPGGAGGDAEDEVMEVVWGVTRPRSPLAVVLEDVPDVSRRSVRLAAVDSLDRPEIDDSMAASLAESMARLEGAPLVATGPGEEEPTNAMPPPAFDPPPDDPIAAQRSILLPNERVSFRVIDAASLSSPATAAERAWQDDPARGVRPGNRPPFPAAWARGTSRNNQQSPEDLLLEEAVAAGAARPARPSPVVRWSRTFTSFLAAQGALLGPLLIASLGVAAAGAVVTWLVTRNDGAVRPRAAATAHLAGRPTMPRTAPPAMAEAPRPAPPSLASDPAKAPPAAGMVVDADEAGDSGRERHRGSDPGKRRARARLDADEERASHGRGERDRATAERSEPGRVDRVDDGGAARTGAERERATDSARPEVAGAALGAGLTSASSPRSQPGPAQPGSTTASKTGTGSPGEAADRALSASAPLPQVGLAHSAGRQEARRVPIIVSPGRTRRESGSMPPVRFPRWERAPGEIRATICIDPRGAVMSARVQSPISSGVRTTIERALADWRYRPVVEGNESVAACFATTFRIQVE